MQTTLKTWARVTAIAGSLIVGLAFLGSTSFSQELAAFEQPCEKFLSDKDLVDALIVQRTNQTTKPIYVAELVTTLSKLGFRDEVSTWLASMSVGEFDRFDNRKVTSDLLDAAEKGDFDRVK